MTTDEIREVVTIDGMFDRITVDEDGTQWLFATPEKPLIAVVVVARLWFSARHAASRYFAIAEQDVVSGTR